MIARNFYTHGFHLCYPQIDWAGPAPEYVCTEFPLVPFLAALVYLLTGVRDWVGRAESVLFFAASAAFFFAMVRKLYSEQIAVFALVVYAFAPLSIFCGRSFMTMSGSE